MIRNIADKLIRKCFYAKGSPWYQIPFYLSIGKWEFCMYARDVNWDSLRIKFERNDCTRMIVIKKGKY